VGSARAVDAAGAPPAPQASPARSRRAGSRPDQVTFQRSSEWTPLTGDALLDRVRHTGRRRPQADPERVAHLAAILESAWQTGDGTEQATADPEQRPNHCAAKPAILTSERISSLVAPTGSLTERGDRERQALTVPIVRGALVRVLFHQLVTVGSIGDPMVDGMEALAADEHDRPLCQWIDGLPPTARDALVSEVNCQAHHLTTRWPTLGTAWYPRTCERIRFAATHGSWQLSASVDLALGRPGLDKASVAFVTLSSGVRRPEHPHARRFAALIETLRHPAPPFAVATYYAQTGELDVDPVDDELLEAAARRTAAGLHALVASSDPCGSGAATGSAGAAMVGQP